MGSRCRYCAYTRTYSSIGIGATPAVLAVPEIVVAKGVAEVPAIATNASVTHAQVDSSRVAPDQHAVNEAKC